MYRATMFFTADRNSWSETHVLTTAATRNEGETGALDIAKSRAALLGTNARIIAVRVGVVGSPRQARLINLGTATLEAPNFTSPEEGKTTADSPHVAVVARCSGTDEGGNLHQGRIFLSGVPDALVTVRGSNPQFVPTTQWTTRFTAYTTKLFENQAGFRITRRYDEVPVDGLVVSNAPPGEIGIRFAMPTPVVAVGDYVHLVRFARKSIYTQPLNGKWQVSGLVAPTSPDTLTTAYLRSSGGIDTNSFASLGGFYRTYIAYTAYEDITASFATHRNRGGSYGLQRGRSRTKKR